MTNTPKHNFIKELNRSSEILELVSTWLDIPEIDWDNFVKKVKHQVRTILYKIIIEEELSEKTNLEAIDIVIDRFKHAVWKVVIEKDIIQNVENWLWPELFETNVLKRSPSWYNIIYLNVLLSITKEIFEIAKPIIEEQNLTNIQVHAIKIDILSKIEWLKSLNYLEYLMNWYIERLETTKESYEVTKKFLDNIK